MKCFVLTTLLLISCQTPAPKLVIHGDCRPSAEVSRNESEKKIEITFYESLAEILDGEVYCDFAGRRIKVDNALAVGKPLELIDRNGTFAYQTDYTFDMGKPVLSFELDGHGYISDLDSMETREGYVRVRMRNFPPK